MKSFQIGVLIVFAALAVIAVLIFATFSGGGGANLGKVSIWGTLPEATVTELLDEVENTESGLREVTYREIPNGTFISALVEAIAAGRGPDLVILPAAAVENERDKLVTISYGTVSRRNFQDAFVEAGEVFLADEGVLGLPFYIDPFVTYWNRTLFSQAGIPRTVRYWDEFVDVAPLLSRASAGGTLTQSAVALGEWDNVNHAKEIFVSLIAGLGNAIVSENAEGTPIAILANSGQGQTSPAESALRFYTEFADPVRSVYSWNRSLPRSRDAFLAGTLAVYLGNASEVFPLRTANPNLNFDVAPYPEVRGGNLAVPADLYALAIPRGSTNAKGALSVALVLAGTDAQKALASITGLPSVRRDVLAVSPENPYESTFRDAALNAFTFRDPDPAQTDAIFERMVEGVSSGRFRIPEAVRSGQTELEALLR